MQSTVSVTKEIRRFEESIEQSDSSQSHLEWQRLKGPARASNLSTSMDSLLESEPAPPRPTTPPQPARRRVTTSSSPQKRVTIATDQLVTVHSLSCTPELEIEDYAGDSEPPPCLPSVRELAVRYSYQCNFERQANIFCDTLLRFQPRKSPEPKPRRSLLKVISLSRLSACSCKLSVSNINI